MVRRKGLLRLERSIKWDAAFKKEIKPNAVGSGYIGGLGNYVGQEAIVIVLPKDEKKGE